MAAIRERGGRFQARVRRDGYAPVTKTFHTKRDAVAWARSVEVAMDRSTWQDGIEGSDAPTRPTLSKAIETYEATVGKKLKGADDYAYRYALIRQESFASKPINEVTARDLSAWRDRLALDRKPSTVVRLLALLSAVFTWAQKEQGWCDSNPLSLVRRPRVVDARDRTLSPEELSYLLDVAKGGRAPWIAPALVVLLNSAMRRGELFRVQRSDIDFNSRVVHLHDTKAGAPRDVPCCPKTLQALRELDEAAAARKDTALLPITDAGSLSTRFTDLVRRARSRYLSECQQHGALPAAGFLDNLRLHDCRHHAVTQWATTGALSLVELMAVSGHSHPKMLTRYTHLKASGWRRRWQGWSARGQHDPAYPCRSSRPTARRGGRAVPVRTAPEP